MMERVREVNVRRGPRGGGQEEGAERGKEESDLLFCFVAVVLVFFKSGAVRTIMSVIWPMFVA